MGKFPSKAEFLALKSQSCCLLLRQLASLWLRNALFFARAQTSLALTQTLFTSLQNFPSVEATCCCSFDACFDDDLVVPSFYSHSSFVISALTNCALYSLYSGRSQSERSQPNLVTEILGHPRPPLNILLPNARDIVLSLPCLCLRTNNSCKFTNSQAKDRPETV